MATIHTMRSGALVNQLYIFRTETVKVSRLRLSASLGISPKQLARLESLPDYALPPAIKLACTFIGRIGLDWADQLPNPRPADMEHLVSKILLTREQIATIMGKRRQVLYSLCTGSQQQTIKRFYYFALMQIKARYGLHEEAEKELAALLAEGERYRERNRYIPYRKAA